MIDLIISVLHLFFQKNLPISQGKTNECLLTNRKMWIHGQKYSLRMSLTKREKLWITAKQKFHSNFANKKKKIELKGFYLSFFTFVHGRVVCRLDVKWISWWRVSQFNLFETYLNFPLFFIKADWSETNSTTTSGIKIT